jgi:hypothetical protein
MFHFDPRQMDARVLYIEPFPNHQCIVSAKRKFFWKAYANYRRLRWMPEGKLWGCSSYTLWPGNSLWSKRQELETAACQNYVSPSQKRRSDGAQAKD